MPRAAHRVGGDDTEISGINFDDFEFDCTHATADQEKVIFAHGAVRLEEIGLEERLEEVARHALDGVIDGQYVDTLAVLDVGARCHHHDVTQAHLRTPTRTRARNCAQTRMSQR